MIVYASFISEVGVLLKIKQQANGICHTLPLFKKGMKKNKHIQHIIKSVAIGLLWTCYRSCTWKLLNFLYSDFILNCGAMNSDRDV